MEGLVNWLTQLDLGKAFVPTLPLPEAILRMSVVYLVIYALLRTITKREVGALGITDLLVVVLIADAAQNAMAGEYKSITDGLILVGVLVFWDWFLTLLAFRFPAIRHVVVPKPLLLVRNGRPVHANLAKVMVTEDELLGQVRLQGIGKFQDVEYAFLEVDGRVSVLPREGKEAHGNDDGKRTG